ncbi:MAG: ComF family protein [Bacteroidetes bacterium]|nr:ComF family protein [Bacteroidota bacterium]
MSFINDFLSLIFPRNCEACLDVLYKHEQFMCNKCLINLPNSVNQHKSKINLIFAGRIPVKNTFCLYVFLKDGKVQKLLHSIKYQEQNELAEFIGNQFALKFKNDLNDLDCIIPIPLHAKKLKQRGFNQSEIFAKGISKQSNLPIISNNLIRETNTRTQTKKRKYERWQNVEGVFSLTNPNELINKHVLLVDDVITTGATIEAAWQHLKAVEGIKITIGSIAYAAKT